MLRACEDAAKPSPGILAVANSVSASKEIPASAKKRPIKTRTLKNADCEVDFFFIFKIQVDQV